MKTLILVLTFLLTLPLYSQGFENLCGDHLEDLPIQQNGRTKPLYVHSKEVVKFLTGKKSIKGSTPLKEYCLLSLSKLQTENTDNFEWKAPIEHVKVRRFLEIGDKKSMPFNQLEERSNEIRAELFKQKLNTSYKKSLQKLMQRLGLFKKVQSGGDWLAPKISAANQVEWIPIMNLLNEQAQAGTQNSPIEFFQRIKEQYKATQDQTYLLELKYFKWHPFSYAMLFCLIGIFALALQKRIQLAYACVGITLALETFGIVVRVLISGRAPITNMYETVMFSGYGALILALIMTYTRKDKIFVLAALVYNILCLLMMQFANNMLTPSISPLVPVLRDNFWLSTHVTSVIVSYAAYAISWILANIVLIKKRFFGITKKEMTYYSDLIYTSLKYGSILIAIGIILGGVWADYSWGRFWGWDPKETWSLIVLCIYMAILHGRYTNWINADRFIFATAGAFMSVMMAWFGVNYILASGLHSYGFSEGGAIFLGSFFAVQTGILIISLLPGKNTKISKA